MGEKPLIWCHEFERDLPYDGVTAESEEMLKQHFELITPSMLEKSPDRVKDVQGIALSPPTLIKYPLFKLESFPKLKVVANWGAGVNHLTPFMPKMKEMGIKLSYTPYAVTKGTADMGMALLLASARNLISGQAEATGPGHESGFRVHVHGEEVNEATIGIVGMGKIGLEVAKRARGFDMNVLYHNRNRRPQEEEATVSAMYCPSLAEMLPQCDFVMITCPLTEETKYLIGEKEFSLMKKSATIINIARGPVIHSDSLAAALKSKRIRAAALDVTDPEPLPAVHPLLELDNVIIQPHRGSASNKTRRKMMQTLIDGLKAVLIDKTEIPDYCRYDL